MKTMIYLFKCREKKRIKEIKRGNKQKKIKRKRKRRKDSPKTLIPEEEEDHDCTTYQSKGEGGNLTVTYKPIYSRTITCSYITPKLVCSLQPHYHLLLHRPQVSNLQPHDHQRLHHPLSATKLPKTCEEEISCCFMKTTIVETTVIFFFFFSREASREQKLPHHS